MARLALGTPVGARVPVIADQFLLLGVDRDHRLPSHLELENLTVDVLELGVPVGMAAPLTQQIIMAADGDFVDHAAESTGSERARESSTRGRSQSIHLFWLSPLAQQFDIHPNQITQWKAQLLDGAAGVFGSESRTDGNGPAVDVTVLHAKIGELTLENDFLAGALGKAGLLSAKR